MYRLLSRWINISKPAFPVFYLFIITPYSVFFFAHHGHRIVFQSGPSPNRKSASIYYIWGYSTHTRAEEWLTFCVSERKRAKDSEREGEVGALDRERKECDIGNCWRPWFHWHFLWMAAICPCLSWHSNLRAGLKMVGDLFSLLFGMNANSGMAGPTAAFTSFQSHWLKWLCDTACITARSHSRSQSLYFVPYLSPASFFVLSLAMPLFISQLLRFCVISSPRNSTCHWIIFQHMEFSFSTVHSVNMTFCGVHMSFVCFFLSVCVLKWRET